MIFRLYKYWSAVHIDHIWPLYITSTNFLHKFQIICITICISSRQLKEYLHKICFFVDWARIPAFKIAISAVVNIEYLHLPPAACKCMCWCSTFASRSCAELFLMLYQFSSMIYRLTYTPILVLNSPPLIECLIHYYFTFLVFINNATLLYLSISGSYHLCNAIS